MPAATVVVRKRVMEPWARLFESVSTQSHLAGRTKPDDRQLPDLSSPDDHHHPRRRVRLRRRLAGFPVTGPDPAGRSIGRAVGDPAESPADEREVAGTITVAVGMVTYGSGRHRAGGARRRRQRRPAEPRQWRPLPRHRRHDLPGHLGQRRVGTDLPDGLDATSSSAWTTPATGWDMANAELLGLEEANGIVFMENAQVLGFLEVGLTAVQPSASRPPVPPAA